MATVAIWPGSSSFAGFGDTPFGIYDGELRFQDDAEKVADWCARRMGHPLVSIELQATNFWACFEEATLEYTAQVNRYNIRENLLVAKGTSTGSNLSHRNLSQNLGSQIAISKQYGTEAGVGGEVEFHSASIQLSAGIQTYDLDALIGINSATAKDIEVRRVFFETSPAMTRFFDPHVGSGVGSQQMLQSMGMGGMSPAVNYLMMPLYDDLLRIQAIEFNDLVRKSAHSFELTNNKLTILPVPKGSGKLWLQYIETSDRNNVLKNPTGAVSDFSNINYANTLYTDINDPGKQWIRKYTLALSKELLGIVRGKYPTIPIPGGETSLDGDTLRSEGAAERDVLIEQLREDLEQSSRRNMMERNSEEAQFQQDTINKVPLNIYVG